MTTLKPTISINIDLSARYCRNDTKASLPSHKSCLYRADSKCSLFKQPLKIGATGEWVRLKECKESEEK